mmetsp:Transcript_10411/g.18724  ORF Transcript_10411/g.18724 Transcript_10411/m.18724 type:complete len:564 (-) Transcript_10411:36-1727(-)
MGDAPSSTTNDDGSQATRAPDANVAALIGQTMVLRPRNRSMPTSAESSSEGHVADVVQAIRSSLQDFQELQALQWHSGWDVTFRLEGDSASTKPRRGTTCGYNASGGTFDVRSDSSSAPSEVVKVHPEEMIERGWECFVAGSQVANSSSDCPSNHDDHLISAARRFFVPGSRFTGTIAIPGMGQSEEDECARKEYTVAVLSEFVDELGQQQLLAQHAAYGDLQACHISFGISAATAQVEVSFSDSETFCEGTVDIATGAVSGRVNQLVQGEEGFFEPSAEVTHTFELAAVGAMSRDVEAAHHLRLDMARNSRVRRLCKALHHATRSRELDLVLADVPWKEVFEDAERLCEIQCATMRRLSKLLDGLHFDTPERKDSVMQLLAQQKVTRAAFHKSSDEDFTLLTLLLRAMPPGLRSWSLNELQSICLKGHHRLGESFGRFDKSLRHAEARLPQSTLDSWRKPLVESLSADAPEPVCAVCFLQLSDSDETPILLPCGHWFHYDCTRRWVHAHTTCPTCRFDLTCTCISQTATDLTPAVDACHSEAGERPVAEAVANPLLLRRNSR